MARTPAKLRIVVAGQPEIEIRLQLVEGNTGNGFRIETQFVHASRAISGADFWKIIAEQQGQIASGGNAVMRSPPV